MRRRHSLFGQRKAAAGGHGLAIARRPRRAVSCLVRDLFVAADAAPLNSPRPCQPGPGTLIATQTDGAFSTTAGQLQLAPQATPTTGDLALRVEDAVDRSDQRPLMADVEMDDGDVRIGYWPTTTLNGSPAHAVRILRDGDLISVGHALTGDAGLTGLNPGMRLQIMIQPRAAGGAFYYFLYPGFSSQWNLFGFDRTGSAANLYGGIANDTGVGVCRKLAVADESFVPATAVSQATPTLNSDFAAPADAVIDAKITLGPALVNGHKAEIRFRYQDANNHWSLQAAVTGGAVVLGIEEVTEGVATLRSAETLPLSAGESAFVQLSAGSGVCFSRWRATDAAAEIHTGPLYADSESRGNDRVAVMQLSVVGTPTISNLTVHPMVNKEIPRAI